MQDISATPLLANLPEGAEGHFLLYFYAVIARLLTHPYLSEHNEQHLAQMPFLANYRTLLRANLSEELAPEMENAWWDAQIALWEKQTPGHLPLRALANEIGLSIHEIRMLIAAGIVEEDIRFGALFATLQEPLAARRPCMGLLTALLGETRSMAVDTWQMCHTLLNSGLLTVENRTDPRAEWILRVSPAIWDAVRGRPATKPAPGLSLQRASDFPVLDELILPTELHTRISHLPDLLHSNQVTAIVLRGMNGSGRRSTLGALARSLQRNVLLYEGGKPGDDAWQQLGPLATLYGALPVVRCDPGPGETLDLPELAGYTGPVGITSGRTGGLRGPLLTHALSLNVSAPDSAHRRRFWQATHVPVQRAALDDIAARFLLTGGQIHKTAALAHAYARLAKRARITTTDVQQATRALNRQSLETLATALEPAHGWSDLIVSNAITQELHTLEARCRSREALCEHTGPAIKQSLNHGVRVLFSGPSGTGKTLAARALAAALQMDLYRIDLAAVVNKYIGETERNLNQVFSRAEELDIVLLLDEGDALMANRTDVRSANDRYANLETNYLLQRLENYEGIVIITTNAGNRIDQAFARRIDVTIDFVPPEAPERWQIWQSHLPSSHTVSAPLLEEVATSCVLTGGQIRNAALHAALLALGDAGAMNDVHLGAALQREYRRAGAVYPLCVRGAVRDQAGHLQRLASELR